MHASLIVSPQQLAVLFFTERKAKKKKKSHTNHLLPAFTLHRSTLIYDQLERSSFGRFSYFFFRKVHVMEIRQRPSLEFRNLEKSGNQNRLHKFSVNVKV